MSLVNNSANNFKDFLDAIKPFLNYQFYDMSGQGVEANNFSTDEKVIGTWIDGKPLYQKTVHFGSLPNNSTKGVQSNISNLDIVVDIVCCAKQSVNIGTGTPLVVHTIIPTVYRSLDASNNVGIQIENGEIRISTTANDSERDAYVTLRYTKTTDTAVASGEKIVGQWIDGKPVFEKTFNISTIQLGSNQWTTVSSINCNELGVDKIVNSRFLDISQSASTNRDYIGASYNINTSEHLRAYNVSAYAVDVNTCILQYTKTT